MRANKDLPKEMGKSVRKDLDTNAFEARSMHRTHKTLTEPRALDIYIPLCKRIECCKGSIKLMRVPIFRFSSLKLTFCRARPIRHRMFVQSRSVSVSP